MKINLTTVNKLQEQVTIKPTDSISFKNTLSSLFEKVVDQYPDATALLSEEMSLSYFELDQKANQLANFMNSQGIGVGDFVAVYLDRSIKPIISILAILKAGATYIPIDPSYPEDRIKYILEEASVSLVISERGLADNKKNKIGCLVLFLDDLNILNKYLVTRLSQQQIAASDSDLSYILFTSGTTGRPKGIMTEHRNVVGFIHAFNQVIKVKMNDRIYQGFSLGFDGSVEEMWMAFSNGATLVVSNPIAAKLPDEAARIMNEFKVTVFSSVPTFLGLIKQTIPSLRLIILSGEKCPSSLVDVWETEGRRILNVYGPTETTVNTTVKECRRGSEITIGTPLVGYQLYILDEFMNPVKKGESGELYIGGIGVSRGYFNNEELTLKTFVKNPFYQVDGGSPIIYRSGDKVCELENGEIQFFGRLDTQVKIRGFRVELSEIEAVISEAPHVKSVLVQPYKRSPEHLELVAYALPHCAKEEFDYQGILILLKSRLPAYMIPSYFDLLDEFPMLASGKADRKNLPTPIRPLIDVNQSVKLPSNPVEEKIVAAWKQIFKIDAISTEADFFLDLAGYSLLAVEAVSLLRAKYQINISVRDLYHLKTIEKIAAKINHEQNKNNSIKSRSPKITASAKEVFKATSKWERYLCLGLQTISLFFIYLYPVAIIGFLTWVGQHIVAGNIAYTSLIYLSIPFILFGFPLHLLTCVALKWIIIGKYRAGAYPLWSLYYFRWWWVSRIQAASGSALLVGTPMFNIYLRLMGSKVGANSLINTHHLGSFDLLKIGSNTSIGQGSHISGHRIENGMLLIAGCEIGNDCFIGDHSCLSLNTKMNNNSKLEDLSLLIDHQETAEGVSYVGSPAEIGKISLPEINDDQSPAKPVRYSILFLLALMGIQVIFLLLSLPLIAILAAGFYWGGFGGLVGALLFDAIFGVIVFCLGIAIVRKIIMPQTPTGIFKVYSLFYVRKWMMDKIFASSVGILHSLYTTIYLPTWLRMMGAKIGRLAEISTVSKMTPDLTLIGDGSFFADGSMIGGLRLYKNHILLAKNKIGTRSFVGNNAHLSVGKSLGDNCLLGVLSSAPQEHISTPDNSEWLGAPSFSLPHRKKITTFDITQTFKPTTKLYIYRFIIDGMRILIPNFIGLASSTAMVLFFYYGFYHLDLLQLTTLGPLVGISLTVIVAMSVVFLKKIIMGRFYPVIKPLWCTYVWCNELINGVYETIAAPLLSPLLGTPFFNIYLRMMGCKIGKNVYMGTTLFSEWDLVSIGDYTALNEGVVIQNHLFEDRIMKSSYLKIGNECSIGNLSVVLYDSEIGDRTNVQSLSLVMKGENLPENTNWEGIPISEK